MLAANCLWAPCYLWVIAVNSRREQKSLLELNYIEWFYCFPVVLTVMKYPIAFVKHKVGFSDIHNYVSFFVTYQCALSRIDYNSRVYLNRWLAFTYPSKKLSFRIVMSWVLHCENSCSIIVLLVTKGPTFL